MVFSEAQLLQWLSDAFWPFIRFAALFMAAPVFSLRQFSVRARVLLAAMTTWLILPLLPPAPAVSVLSPEGVLIAFQQIAIGVSMGFLMQMVFQTVIFGGQIVAYKMGLGFAFMMDPQNGIQVPVVSQFYLLVATLAFVVSNGHLVLLGLLAESFTVLPVASVGMDRDAVWSIVGWASEMFASGVVMSLPVIVALLLVNFAMGVVGRASPQLNIFAVGFPITLLSGFILMWVTLPQVLRSFGEVATTMLGQMLPMLSGGR